MKSFAVVALLAICTFHFGSAEELARAVRKNVESLKGDVQTLHDLLEATTVEYFESVNKHVEANEAKYYPRFNEEVKSALGQIKDALKGHPEAHRCYEAAESRFAKLNATSFKNLEQCEVNKEEGLVPENVVVDLIEELKRVKQFIELADKLEKEFEAVQDSDLNEFNEKRVVPTTSAFKLYEFAVDAVLKRAAKADDEFQAHVAKCSEKELADVHAVTLIVREIAFNCINSA